MNATMSTYSSVQDAVKALSCTCDTRQVCTSTEELVVLFYSGVCALLELHMIS